MRYQEALGKLSQIRSQIADHSVPPEALEALFAGVGLPLPDGNTQHVAQVILRTLNTRAGYYYLPTVVRQAVTHLLKDRNANVVCDPWPGLGELLCCACEVTHANKAYAIGQNEDQALIGKILCSTADWRVGRAIAVLEAFGNDFDFVVSNLPFNAAPERLSVIGKDGTSVNLRDDLGNLVLVAAASHLAEDGLGLFVVPPSFFILQRSVYHQLSQLGLGIDAALYVRPGSFAPYTNIAAYLVAIRKGVTSRMFVAELTGDHTTDALIISNYKEGKEGGRLELGKFIDRSSFTGLAQLRLADQLDRATAQFNAPNVRLGDLAHAIHLGRSGDVFFFPEHDNAIFIPLIGSSNVVESAEELSLKRNNYAQVLIDPSRSNAHFVSRFLNSELGREIGELSKSGAYITKLNKQTLKDLNIIIPDLQTQKSILEMEAKIAAEQNTLLGLQNELSSYRRELWTKPTTISSINQRLEALTKRLSGSLTQHAEDNLNQWFETLPFPLASICRAWQTTPSQDFKTKYEHLLHFFEATAEFLSIILLSAFSSNTSLFAPHKQKVLELLRSQKISLDRATFGTWKLIVEYLGKQTRQLLQSNNETKSLCAELFADPSLQLPQAVSCKELASILSTTNKMRNDWSGHGGIVGEDEARLRNEQLVRELQTLRGAFDDVWSNTKLVRALHCRLRRGVFESEIAVLTSSNSEFVKETRLMATCLDVEQLYLIANDSGQPLRLLPLIGIGSSHGFPKNACYFFNRLERGGEVRFISYHFADRPELIGKFDQTLEAIKLLTQP